MRNRTSLIIAALLATVFTGCSKHPPTAATNPQTVGFNSFTNGFVGTLAPVFASLTTNDAAVIQQWLADGTNSAVFTITNHQSCDIWVFPLGRIINAGAHPTNDETLILNAPNFSGIHLRPRQVSTIQVAVLPHQAPWRMEFYYTRTDQHVSLAESLDAMIFRKPIQAQTYTIESDIIEK
jgi:hypothetical protein